MLSTDSDSGEAEASRGDLRLSPRYFVERSLIPLLLPSSRVQVRYLVLPEQCAAIQSAPPWRPCWRRRATDVPRRPAPVSAILALLPDRFEPAWCTALPGKHTASMECWAP